MKANTPDFRLEPFIVLRLDGTSVAPTSWGLESIVMAIQYNRETLSTKDEIFRCTKDETLQYIYNDMVLQ